MSLSKRLFVLVACLLPLAGLPAVDGPAGASVLPTPIREALRNHGLSGDGLSVFVQAVDETEPTLEINAGTPRRPASVIKLLTTYAALDLLGPAYRWETEAWTTGALEDGTLNGDLYLRGTGDPFLTVERFWTFLRELRRKGLRDIRGDLVIDNTYFQIPPEDPGDFDGQRYRSYNVPPDALLVNFGTARFDIQRTGDGGVKVYADPPMARFVIENDIRSKKGACAGFQRGVAFDVPEGFAGRRVVLSGRFPTGCAEYALYRAVLPAPEFAHAVFAALWDELGGSLEGGLRLAPVPETAEPLHRYYSVPLGDVVRQINKWSNNAMTRQLLLTIGAEGFEAPGTPEKGRKAVDQWLAARGLSFPELYLDNGAGLSRKTRIAARSLGRMLLDAWDHEYMPELVSSMPISAVDGTMRRRSGGDMSGRMHLKTGRLDDVAAVAGLVLSRSGKRYVVVIIQNDRDAHRGIGQDIQDVILRWVFDR
ncbi:MAG: D-alanyl-D-alanine carboxypeptidase/D-alanyl-D-alanine-endopeptidase [Gammaproteobacteria bacterium]